MAESFSFEGSPSSEGSRQTRRAKVTAPIYTATRQEQASVRPRV